MESKEIKELVDSTLGQILSVKAERIELGILFTVKCKTGYFQYLEYDSKQPYALWINHRYIDSRDTVNMLIKQAGDFSSRFGLDNS